MTQPQPAATSIAVYGADGHTGRLVVTELARRGHEVVLGGRSRSALEALRDGLEAPAQVRSAHVDDRAALRSLTAGAGVVINCAGPFAATGRALASAAIETGTHYLDHSAEPLYVRALFEQLGSRARAAGVVVVPGMSFFGALADLLAHRLAGDRAEVDEVTVAYAVRGWLMTAGSRATALGLREADRATFRDGTLGVGPPARALATFDFPEPVGRQAVIVDYPAGEVVTIPRHVATRAVRVVMTADTFVAAEVFGGADVDPRTRAGSEYLLTVRAASSTGTLERHLEGSDIYGTGAAVAVEAAVRLARGSGAATGGVRSAAQVFPPDRFLDALEERGVLRQL
ncbi:MAG TPA: saccharopine dehydrogenase NADP-binding domain-containing protein [Nocardioides sp.]|uniref:saccharopine dehydrogenase NADP-binding domain-containing protein n=1 Tax=Nocardioides sp. TaxID=35761 RepID=UPI002E331F82|nr:saccharopine dehydrogenase NADP-binding domain-containing protein [Nocardioides sp.]HEX5087367.1 saccharopine dehydrogenase NADP-binding domain-containing protein [Nocardioides sp.]